jgi:hypothetical protein
MRLVDTSGNSVVNVRDFVAFFERRVEQLRCNNTTRDREKRSARALMRVSQMTIVVRFRLTRKSFGLSYVQFCNAQKRASCRLKLRSSRLIPYEQEY